MIAWNKETSRRPTHGFAKLINPSRSLLVFARTSRERDIPSYNYEIGGAYLLCHLPSMLHHSLRHGFLIKAVARATVSKVEIGRVKPS